MKEAQYIIDAGDRMALYNELKAKDETLISAEETTVAAKKNWKNICPNSGPHH